MITTIEHSKDNIVEEVGVSLMKLNVKIFILLDRAFSIIPILYQPAYVATGKKKMQTKNKCNFRDAECLVQLMNCR